MKDNQAKYPQLRFKGFTDPWEQRKLTEIVNRVNKSSNSDVLPKVEFEDIVSGEGRLNKDISSKFDSRKGTLFEPENILYGKLRPYLKNWLFSDFEGVALGDFWVFEATDVSVPSFDYYLIQSDDYQKVANDTSGTKMPRSDWKNVSSTGFAIPSKDEQKQIGAFFKQLDDTITLHQRKLAKLKELKQGYLQKLFPKNGSKFPQLRFAGFADAWEQRKLGEVAEFSKGNGYTKEDLTENGSPIILYGRLYTKYKAVINDVDTFVVPKDRSVISKGNEVIVPASGETAEDISRASVVGKSGFILGGDLNVIKPDILIDSLFLALTISNGSQQKEMAKRAQGKSVVHLHSSDLQQINLLYPKLKEQRKIGTFFKQLDDTITLHQRKLEKLQELKKGYLQKMFC